MQVSVLHSVQAGLTDKALSYVDRALQLINQEIGGSSYCGTSVHKCASGQINFKFVPYCLMF